MLFPLPSHGHAIGHAPRLDLCGLLVGVVAVGTAGLGGWVGPQVAQHAAPVQRLDARDRLPSDGLRRVRPVLRLQLRPGPAQEIVGEALGRLEIPLADGPILVEPVGTLGGGAPDQLEELRRQRHMARHLRRLDMGAEAVLAELGRDIARIDRTCRAGLAGHDLGHRVGLMFDGAVYRLPNHQIAQPTGQQKDPQEQQHGAAAAARHPLRARGRFGRRRWLGNSSQFVPGL